MSTPHGPERRVQALRRSGAAGIHDDRPTRTEAVRAALADQGVTEEVTMSTHPTDDPRSAAVEAVLRSVVDLDESEGGELLFSLAEPIPFVSPYPLVTADQLAKQLVATVEAEDSTTADLVKRYGDLRDQLAALVAEADGLRAAFGAHRCDLRGDPGAPAVVVARDTARGAGPTAHTDRPH